MAKKQTAPPVIQPKIISATEVQEEITRCRETIEAVLKHYSPILSLLDDGVEIELLAALDNLNSSVDSIEDTNTDLDFEQLLKKLNELHHSEIEGSKLIELLDEEDVLGSLGEDYVTVKLFSIAHKEKLKEFIEREIYTSYNEQRENILF